MQRHYLLMRSLGKSRKLYLQFQLQRVEVLVFLNKKQHNSKRYQSLLAQRELAVPVVRLLQYNFLKELAKHWLIVQNVVSNNCLVDELTTFITRATQWLKVNEYATDSEDSIKCTACGAYKASSTVVCGDFANPCGLASWHGSEYITGSK